MLKIEDIMNLIPDNPGTAINELKNGRRAPLPDVSLCGNAIDPKKHDVMDRMKRKDKWVKVSDEANAKKRRVPVERIPIALQKQIVRSASMFAFANPIDYQCDIDGEQQQRVYDSLANVLYYAKADSMTRQLAKAVSSYTEAAEVWFVEEKPNNRYGFTSKYKLRMSLLSPAKGDVLYPYFDEVGDMTAFGREYIVRTSDGINKAAETTKFDLYTAEWMYKFTRTPAGWAVDEGYPLQNEIGKIPVIYASQGEVEWSDVQDLIDRLETLLSNFADTNDYHASPKIIVKGDILEWAQKGDSGAVIQMDKDGEASYMTWSQAPEAVKLEIETLLKFIYSLTQTPDVSFENVKGLGAISGIALQLLFLDAHLKAQGKMDIYGEYLQRRVAVILAFLKRMNAGDSAYLDACDSIIVKPQIVPYMINDKAAMVSTLSEAVSGSIMSRKTAVTRLGAVEDVDAELERISDEQAAQQQSVFGTGEEYR